MKLLPAIVITVMPRVTANLFHVSPYQHDTEKQIIPKFLLSTATQMFGGILPSENIEFCATFEMTT